MEEELDRSTKEPAVPAKPIFLCLLCLLWLAAAATESTGIEISSVSISSESFSPARQQSVTISYSIDEDAEIAMNVYDPDSRLACSLLEESQEAAGSHQIEWDGRDVDGNVVPDEAYFFTISAEDKSGNRVVYDPTVHSGGDEFDITSARVDRESNTLTYRLDKPSRILIRIGIAGGPLLSVPVSWEPRVSGEITEYWNGRDQDGIIDVLNHPRHKIIITGFHLPENSVITYGNGDLDYADYVSQYSRNRPEKPSSDAEVRDGVKISPHYDRSRLLDEAVDILLTFPEAQIDEGVALLSGASALIKVDISEDNREAFSEEPFEISFFLDGEYYSEEEIGHIPYNWLWNLDIVDEGEHVLTVNVSSFRDIIGIRSHIIRVTD